MSKKAEKAEKIREKTLYVAAKLFLEKGYTQTTLRVLAAQADVDVSAINRAFGCKENILCELVKYVLEEQFRTAAASISMATDDPILFYAAETTMQLYMAESRESVRELYLTAYSLPSSLDVIQQMITEKLEQIFGAHLPQATTKDFYELEIASGSIIRGFMERRCDVYFTMERKVKRYLETTLRIFQVPEEKISEAIAFVHQFDFTQIAEGIIDRMLNYLKEETR